MALLLLNLATGQVIVRPKVQELPITNIIIEAVNQLTTKDRIKSMKFSTIDGLPFEDPAWIAGVDGKESDDNDNKSYSNESDSDTKSDSDLDTESEADEQPDHDDETGLIDESYKGRDFEPKPFKLEATIKDNDRHGEILTHHNHQPNPAMAGLKKFVKKGKAATLIELRQLHVHVCFEPIGVSSMSVNKLRL